MEFLQSFGAILVLIGIIALISGQAKAELIGQDFIYRRKESMRYIKDLNKSIYETKEELKKCTDYNQLKRLSFRLGMYIENLKDEKERFKEIEI